MTKHRDDGARDLGCPSPPASPPSSAGEAWQSPRRATGAEKVRGMIRDCAGGWRLGSARSAASLVVAMGGQSDNQTARYYAGRYLYWRGERFDAFQAAGGGFSRSNRRNAKQDAWRAHRNAMDAMRRLRTAIREEARRTALTLGGD